MKIENNALDSRINIAIDNGLWYLYKQGIRGDGVTGDLKTYDGSPFVYWTRADNYRAAATASAVQSFEINGSKEGGDFDQDPYAEYVFGGLTFLIMGNFSRCDTTTSTIVTDHGAQDLTGMGVPERIAFEMLDTACGGAGTYEFHVNGVSVGSSAVLGDCSCSPGVHTVEVSGADLAAAWGATAGKTLRATFSGGGASYFSRLSANIDFGQGNMRTTCLENVNVESCFSANLCGGYSEAFSFDDTVDLSSVHTFTVTTATTTTCDDPQPILRALTLDLQHGDNPDSNGNTIGIETYDGGNYLPVYQGGQVMAAIIASGTPSKLSGRDFVMDPMNPRIATYAEIIQDMADAMAWGQNDGDAGDGVGSWQYGWQCCNDNSASQWAALGMIPAQQAPWNAVVPQWVKNYDDAWLDASHTTQNGGLWGKFGYVGAGVNVDPFVDQSATTPSGLVQLSFVGKTTADPRWVRAERWIAENWDVGEQWFTAGAKRNLYAMYAMVKAMRLAKPAPVVNFAINGFDWYRGDASHDGVAKALSDDLIANNGQYSGTFWEQQPLASAWAVIMLKPTLFAAAPLACFTSHPNPTFSDLPVSFDPRCSGHSEPGKGLANVKKFEWDWNDDGTFDQTTATPEIVSHTFHCDVVPCAFPVTLRVSDDNTPPVTATFVMDVRITDPPHPPVSRSKAIYWVSECDGDTLTLDGSDSFDPDEGKRQAGCADCPVDTVTAWQWDFDGSPFDYTSASGKIVNLGAGFGGTFPAAGSYDIGLRVTDNTALAYPASGSPDLTDEGFSKVVVFDDGACDLGATPRCDSVHLAWSSTGATSYHVYRSFNGPNADFVEVANTGSSTSADIAATLGQSEWFRVLGVKGDDETLSKAVFVKLTPTDCVCIVDLKAAAKNRLVQLSWAPKAGARCYNVYRSTIANVPTDAGHRIATCVVSAVAVYNDTGVVNGTKYYYKVTKVEGDVETCVSNEVNATPAFRPSLLRRDLSNFH